MQKAKQKRGLTLIKKANQRFNKPTVTCRFYDKNWTKTFFLRSELQGFRKEFFHALDLLGITDYPGSFRKILPMDDWSDEEINILFSKDVKINRLMYERLIGNIEGLLVMFLNGVLLDTMNERKKAHRRKGIKVPNSPAPKKSRNGRIDKN